ncbi:MAG: hypothetical protein PVJ67_04785 [Candidatus Pacearchaeota archaeon]|jgi:hypothetical protein
MALEDFVVGSAEEVIKNLTKILAAFGGVLFLYLVFQIVNFFINRKKLSKIKEIEIKLNEVLKILKKKKK